MPTPPKRPQAFMAGIDVDDRRVYLGRWPSREEADLARDRAILHMALKRPLRRGKKARELGPASPAELVAAARALVKRNTSSRFLGVSWDFRFGLWRISIKRGDKKYTIAGIDTEERAAELRDRLALHLFGGDATLNFPERRLRAASYEQLQTELRAARSTSRYRGVSWDPNVQTMAWSAEINVGPRKHFLGRHATEKDAAAAYDRAALHYLGGSAKLNFPAVVNAYEPADANALRAEARAEFKKHTSSRFRGVTRSYNLWVAKIVANGHKYRLGSFMSEEEAALAYDEAALRLHGDAARLNFGERARGAPTKGQRTKARASQNSSKKRASGKSR